MSNTAGEFTEDELKTIVIALDLVAKTHGLNTNPKVFTLASKVVKMLTPEEPENDGNNPE